MSNGILAIPGMVSGLPTQQLIQQLVAARQATETPLINQRSVINNQIQAWNGVTPLISDLQNAVQTLVNPSTWNTMSTTNSNPAAISVTASTGATAATYSLKSDQLAQGQTSATASVSPTNVGAQGSFTITQNGNTETINVNDGDSLQAIASAINTNASTVGVNVSASVITNTDGTASMMISSTQTGANSAFTVTAIPVNTSIDPSGHLSLTTTMTAQDAQAEINGVSVTSSTNTFSNVVGGLGFTLNQGGGVTSTVTVAQDTSTITNAVNGFMKSYNALVQNLESISKIDTDGKGANNGPLAGDNTVQSLLMNLETAVGNEISNGGTFKGLGSIGIVLNSDGTLAYDTTAANNGGPGGLDGKAIFSDALTSNPQDMQTLFGVVTLDGLSPTTGLGGLLIAMENTTQGISAGILTAATDPVNGTITSEVSSLNSQTTTLTDQIKQIDDASQQYQDQLQAQFNAMETEITKLKAQQQWLDQFASTSTTTSSSTTK